MYNIFFIQSSVDGYLGYFHVLAIVNSAAMNTRMHVSFQIMFFSGYMSRSEIAGLYGMLWKCCTQYASKFGKLGSDNRGGKCQFSFQFWRKAMPKNAQTTTHLRSSHMLVKYAQNPPSQASTIHEPWTSRCSSSFYKGRETRDQIANIHWIIEKAREFQKNIYFCFIKYAKAFDCVDHNKLWKILKEMGIAAYLTCLLRNLYAGQEAPVRIGHGTTDWLQILKEVC